MNDLIRAYVQKKLDDYPNRLKHTEGVELVAIELSSIYNFDIQKASIAALTHDLMKCDTIDEQIKFIDQQTIDHYRDFPVIYHAYAAANLIQIELNIQDEDIINAVRYHVWGRPAMSLLEKIIFVADFVEPNREFREAKLYREIAKRDLDQAVCLSMKSSIDYLIDQKMTPSIDQYKAYEYYKEVTRG